ncbi:MAG: hypothetical protein IMX01_10135, partial [Limnochordaceae bacterium]|nr:hypothetical protein [Limnochordaceae bacterium]
ILRLKAQIQARMGAATAAAGRDHAGQADGDPLPLQIARRAITLLWKRARSPWPVAQEPILLLYSTNMPEAGTFAREFTGVQGAVELRWDEYVSQCEGVLALAEGAGAVAIVSGDPEVDVEAQVVDRQNGDNGDGGNRDNRGGGDGVLATLLEDLTKVGKPTVLLFTGNPFVVNRLRGRASACLASYDSTPASLCALLEVLLGQRPTLGCLPVKLPAVEVD